MNKKSTRLQRLAAKYKFRYYDRKRNIYSYKSGVEIVLDSNIGRCCNIWHSDVVINGDIGDNCVVGAGAVITKSFDKNGSVIVGIPGKMIK